jgi:fluoroquinolone transport system ATP-binding protein
MIQVDNISFSYAKEKEPAIKNISFQIKKGEIFGFLGPNGAGKSTTQKLLTKLLKPSQGSISVLGKNLADWKSDYYEHIGVCFELPNHYSKLTGLENLQFFGAFYKKQTMDPKEVLKLVELDDASDKRVGNYSKGMKMRLNFARSLLNDPEILFLDEATTGQDPKHQRLIKDIIMQKKKEGKTIFLSTHNMQDAEELCDRVAFLVKGQIRTIENPQELKIREGKKIVEVGYRVDSQIKKIEFPLDNLGSNQEFIKFLKDNQIETIHSKDASLEQIFIRITGTGLE